MKQWYALYTKLRAEKRVVVALQQYGIETFYPTIQSNSNGQKHEIVALFPGYLFMRANLKEENTAHWRWVPGVRNVVTYGDWPVALPDTMIDALKRETEQRDVVGPSATHNFRDGDVVRIMEGPFAEMLAIFEGPTTADQRVTVLLEFMGRLCRIQTDSDHLEIAKQDQRPKRPRRTRGRGRRIRSQYF